MSFFRRDDEPPAAQPVRRPAAPSAPPTGADQPVTRIAPGTRITGEISGTTELLIEGEVDGRIRLDGRVVVGKSGGVLGEIHGRSVLIAGRVEGPVRGSERVEVGGTGRLEGDIAAPRVTIAEGAFFKGKVEMGGGGERRVMSQQAAPPTRGGGGRGIDPDDSPTLFPGEEPGKADAGPGGNPAGSTGSAGSAGSTGPVESEGSAGVDGTSGRGGKA